MEMKKIKASTLIPGRRAEEDIYSDKHELLIGKGTLISQRHRELMWKRNIFEVYVKLGDDASVPQDAAPSIGADAALDSQNFTELQPVELCDHPVYLQHYEQLLHNGLVTCLDEQLEGHELKDTPDGMPLKSEATQMTFAQRSKPYLDDISFVYETALASTRKAIGSLLQGDRSCGAMISSIVREFTRIFRSDKSILLNIASCKPSEEEYLYYHSLNVCILSINIAAAHGYNEAQIVEIGSGALLHDIGMFLIPPEVRRKNTRLNDTEWYEVKKHPILGITLLERVIDLSESVLFIAYQTHERQNATGYPKQRTDRLIHQYAKVVQIADIYEAFSTVRPHRPALTPFKAISNLVGMAKIGLVAKHYVKAFISYMSSFPVGSLVLLSNNCIAKVIDTHEHAITKPVLSIITDHGGKLLQRKNYHQIDLRSCSDISIVRPLSSYLYQNIGLMDGF
ncbi:MAG: HD domain-containing protein [Chitinivibrionales bacterium]|nr:HD domain-containing protein [Chitinivibrionales bacterium]